MSHDVHHKYRQRADFLYFSGLQEPGIVILVKGGTDSDRRFILLVQPSDEAREQWTGTRAGLLRAAEVFSADEVLSLDARAAFLEKLLGTLDCVFVAPPQDPAFAFERDLRQLIANESAKRCLPLEQFCKRADHLCEPLRLIKSESEIALIQKAADAAAAGVVDVMRACRAGMTEDTLAALFEFRIRQAGCQRTAYPTIVAGGEHACILHYPFADDVLR